MRDPTFADDTLLPDQIAAYLSRIELSPLLAGSGPSLELLSEVYLAHHYHVPKDTTSMHCSKDVWRGESQPIVLGSALFSMPLRTAAYHRIVELHAGGYCWANNPVFAALLRGLGYRVSECATKVFKNWANLDPAGPVVKNRWGTFTHVVLVVDWKGSTERYVLDVGFGGGGCPIPMPLRDGATVLGLNPFEAWTIRHEPFPHEPEDPAPIDVIPGWTMYRRTPLPGSSFAGVPDPTLASEWVHQYHFLLSSITVRDIGLFDYYSQAHPLAAFTGFFLVTRLLPGTGGARRSVMFAEHMAKDGKRLAKVHTTGGLDNTGAPRDVEYVPMETGPMRCFLEKEFGFVF
ncbi:arylamine N-acetyltransferase 1 [Mycena amicta]|nr:arylamine N-acetyltransferase 1 [Mycena amicta]